MNSKQSYALVAFSIFLFAVAPSFLLASTAASAYNFAGYAGVVPAGKEATSVTGQWIVPSVACNSKLSNEQLVSIFVGLQSSNQNVFADIGTFALCGVGASTPGYFAFAIYGPLDSGPVLLGLAVAPGNIISATITLNPATFSVNGKITNLSTHKSITYTKVDHGINPIYAYWDISNGGYSLAKFAKPISFQDCTATVSGASYKITSFLTIIKHTMTDSKGKALAIDSKIASSGEAFSITWKASS